MQKRELSGTFRSKSKIWFLRRELIALDGGRSGCEYISKGLRPNTEISAPIIDENV